MDIKKMNATVPLAIAQLINKKGMKQKAVAERSGLSQQELCDMLKGRRIIKVCDIVAIANALDAQPNDLFKT